MRNHLKRSPGKIAFPSFPFWALLLTTHHFFKIGQKLIYSVYFLQAYVDWILEHGEEEVLPDLQKTSQQLFFIGYAQVGYFQQANTQLMRNPRYSDLRF